MMEPLRILLVDGNRDQMILTRYFLGIGRQTSFDLTWQSTYEEGIRSLQEEHFDAILLDYRLGKKTGLDLMQEMLQAGIATPFIILTSHGDEDIAVRAMKLGAMDYLSKQRITSEALQRSILNAVEKARLKQKVENHQKELERLARHDELTGLLNRRALFECLQMEFYRALRHEDPFSLLMVDLDHFKDVNDTYGHLVGDTVLVSMAKTIQEAIRSIDLAGRYGGEEFVIILPQTPLPGALAIADRLLKRFASLLHTGNNTNFRVTCSAGVSCYQQGDEAFDCILERADKSLYHAKCAGRNRVCGLPE